MWIVSGIEKGSVRLVSSKAVDALLPIGSYLTIVDDKKIKHILYVEDSYSKSLFEPSPLVVDAGLPILKQDQEVKNIVIAKEIRQTPLRKDGLFSHIKPNEIANRITQDEIDEMYKLKDGYPVFLATNYLKQNAVLKDDHEKRISVKIPFSSLYLQTMIVGQTGSGKTVAMKHLIEQFINHEKGAVLALNVKSDDLLILDQPTVIKNDELKKNTEEEWNDLKLNIKNDINYKIYIPYRKTKAIREGINKNVISQMTLKTIDLEPNALLGVLINPTDKTAELLPNIFRYWKTKGKTPKTFKDFIEWFRERATSENKYTFKTLDHLDEESEIPIHPSTCQAIQRSLENARSFFDGPESTCVSINDEHLLVNEKISVIDLSNKDTTVFGAILLRHLISKIYDAKANQGLYKEVPILIIIDEVHNFIGSTASSQALEELNAIARMGRHVKIGVIFASQDPSDLPEGLTHIVNTRIFFRSLGQIGRKYDVQGTGIDASSLESGYAIMSNSGLEQIRFVKFPIPLRGVKVNE